LGVEALTTEASKVLLTQGILGLLVILFGGVIAYLYKHHNTCQAARFEEYKSLVQTAVKAINDAADETRALTTAMEGNNRAMEARARATEEVANNVARQEHINKNLADRLTDRVEEALRILRGGR
jgi:ribosomal protein S20